MVESAGLQKPILLSLRRAAYLTLISTVSKTQSQVLFAVVVILELIMTMLLSGFCFDLASQEKIFTSLLFREDLMRSEHLWDNLVDKSVGVTFPVETTFPVIRVNTARIYTTVPKINDGNMFPRTLACRAVPVYEFIWDPCLQIVGRNSALPCHLPAEVQTRR